VKAKSYRILLMAVEEGVRYGVSRSKKYDPNPSDEAVVDTLTDAVMSHILEYFNFDESEINN
jgi:hypothetical protein